MRYTPKHGKPLDITVATVETEEGGIITRVEYVVCDGKREEYKFYFRVAADKDEKDKKN